MREIGASEEEIDAALAAREPSDEAGVGIWPEHVEAFGIFCELETQWRVAAGFTTMRTGLDYTAVLAFLQERVGDAERRREVFWQLQQLERGAIAAWLEKEKKAPPLEVPARKEETLNA